MCREMTRSKLYDIVKCITVEPTVLFYFTAFMIVNTLDTNLYIQKTCRENTTFQPADMSVPCKNETSGVTFASKMNASYRSVMFFVCIIYTMFATCWSDETGKRRRPLILLPSAGLFVHCTVGCLHSYFWHWNPTKAAFTEFLIEGLSGGVTLMTVASQIYICDVSDTENRTMRLGLLHAVKILCLPLGKGSAGFILSAFGFFHSYLLCAALSAVAFILAAMLVHDVSGGTVLVEKRYFRRVINLASVRDSFRVIFKKSLARRRVIIVVLLIIYVLMYFISQGENTVFYLFVKHKFGWNERDYSLFSVYKYTGVILGTIFCSVVLSKSLKIHDTLIGAIAGFWDTVAVLGYLVASQSSHVYIVALFDIFHGTALSVCFSFLSKHYDSSEFGRLSTVQNVFSLVIPLCHPLYNTVFQKTSQFFPSAFFIISIILNIFVFVLYCSSYSISKKIRM